MFEKAEKIFNAFEKPEAAEPTERMVLVRDGFSICALVLHVFWLAYHRMWLVLAGYVALAVMLTMVIQQFHLSLVSSSMIQLGLQSLLAVHAGDLQGWTLLRRGYRFAGVIVAETEMKAQRRYYEHIS